MKLDMFVSRVIATHGAMHKVAVSQDDVRQLYTDLCDLSMTLVERLSLDGAGSELADAMVTKHHEEVERLAVVLAAKCMFVVNFWSARLNELRGAEGLQPLGDEQGFPSPSYSWTTVSLREHQLRSGSPNAPLGVVVRDRGRFYASIAFPLQYESLDGAMAMASFLVEAVNAALAYPTAAEPAAPA